MATAAFLEPGTTTSQAHSSQAHSLLVFTAKSSNFGIRPRFPVVILVKASHTAKPSASGAGKGREGVRNYDLVMQPTIATLQGCWEGGFVHSFIQCVFIEHLPGTVLNASHVAVNKTGTSPCPPGACILVNKPPDLSTDIYECFGQALATKMSTAACLPSASSWPMRKPDI